MHVGVVAMAAVVVLMFLSSNVLGAAVKSGKVDKAPFKGTPYVFAGVDISGCGTTLAFPTLPNFYISNGTSAFNASTGAKACLNLYSTDTSDVYGDVAYNGSKWTQSSNASQTVTFTYILSYIVSASAKPSKGATADGTAEIYVESEVYDGTTGAVVSSGFSAAVLVSETSGSKTVHKVDQTFKQADGPVSYTAGNFYYVEVFLDSSVYSEVSTTGSSTASASVSLEPGTDISSLESIAIS